MTLTTRHDVVHFRPSRVEGFTDVEEVRVHPDRLELRSCGEWISIAFLSFAPGREVDSGRVPIGQLHFDQSDYAQSHFVFYTTPRIAIYMPADGPTAYPDSCFWRVQEVIGAGGFRLYDGRDGKGPPPVLPDMSARRSVAYVLAVLIVAWLYGLSGFLPGRAGEVARDFLLSNPRNPAIGAAWMLPALAIPILLVLRHGRTARARPVIVALSYVLALSSESALRRAIHAWAPIEQAPFNLTFWSAHHFVTTLGVVAVATLVATLWRRSYLELIPTSERVQPENAVTPFARL
jgi:hypothetical protein